MKTLSLDLETFSGVDLKKCGAYKYAESPDFEIMLFGFSVDGGEVEVIDLTGGEVIPSVIIEALTDDKVTKWAHNAVFERICLSRYLRDMGISLDPFADNHHSAEYLGKAKYLNPESWRCSMVWCAYMGFPLSLEGAGAALGLEKQKLTEGRDLIRYFCVPCKTTAINNQRTRNLPEHAPDKWAAFKSYNIRDVEAEQQILMKLAKFPVPDFVWDEYHLDKEINDRGVALDMTLVKNAIVADERSREKLTLLMREITELENPTSVAQMRTWLAGEGLEMDSLGKKEVAAALKTAPARLAEALTMRQSLAKSSVKKYTAMENVVCSDDRARGLFQFYGAGRTGRWSGRLLQPQNLPQNHLPDLEQARRLVRDGNFTALD
jgi:DNA polymerase